MTAGDSEPMAPIHGYWTRDFKRINARWVNDPGEKRLLTRDDTVFDQLLGSIPTCRLALRVREGSP